MKRITFYLDVQDKDVEGAKTNLITTFGQLLTIVSTTNQGADAQYFNITLKVKADDLGAARVAVHTLIDDDENITVKSS